MMISRLTENIRSAKVNVASAVVAPFPASPGRTRPRGATSAKAGSLRAVVIGAPSDVACSVSVV